MLFLIVLCLFFKVYLFILRETMSDQGRGRERGRQIVWSRLCVDGRGPDTGLELTNLEIMTWTEVRCLPNWATQMLLMFTYLFWERERERQSKCVRVSGSKVGGRDREKERGERIPSRLCAVGAELHMGLNPTTLGSQPEPKSRVRCSTDWATQVLLLIFFHIYIS